MNQEMEGFEEELRALKASYAEQVPEKLAQIDALWGGLVERGWQLDTFKTLHRIIHSMAGSAAIFGFGEMGERARELEMLLKGVTVSDGSLSEAHYQQIPPLIEAVRAAAQQADGG